MRFVVPVVLVLVSIIHVVPVTGMLGPEQLGALYGVPIMEPNLEIVMRHRAVLFGLLAAFLAMCAFRPQYQRLGIVAGLVSVGSFVVLAQLVGDYNAFVAKVVYADLAAFALLIAGAVGLALRRA
jgi:hypothetical protein